MTELILNLTAHSCSEMICLFLHFLSLGCGLQTEQWGSVEMCGLLQFFTELEKAGRERERKEEGFPSFWLQLSCSTACLTWTLVCDGDGAMTLSRKTW